MLVRPRTAIAQLIATVAVLALSAAPARALDGATLAKKLARESRPLGSASGAYVLDVTADRVLFARNADRALIPASNEKLFTTATALLRFGPTATLTTTVRAAPTTTIDDVGVVHGDVYLVGAGDPSLNDVALRELATQLVDERGITRLMGGVIGDEAAFDDLRGGPRTAFGPDRDIGGWLSALTWGHGRAYPGGPAQVAAARLQAFLKELGVKPGRRARSGHLATATGDGEQLAAVLSPPMRRLVQITNRPSDNFYAETLLKDLGLSFGADGSTTAGLAVARDTLTGLGIAPILRDGSGLSRADRATPHQIVTLLAAMLSQAVADDWLASLARPGLRGTTLAHRMRGTAGAGRCRAKTGTLRGVSAISGYCTATSGHTIAFSFLENRVCPVCAKRIEDRMVPAIARYDSSPSSPASSTTGT